MDDKKECYFCKEEKEIGKEQFWCPRLRNSYKNLYFYGDWVCLDCCKKSFYTSMFSIHLDGSGIGSCHSCDFPVASILSVHQSLGKPNANLTIVRASRYERDDLNPSHVKHIIERDKFRINDDSFSMRRYYGFKWDYHNNCIIMTSQKYSDGVAELVLDKKKLPIRKIILLEDVLTFGCISWGELNRYYWSACGHSQHSNEEKWMDDAPIIISRGFIGQNGLEYDKRTKEKIDYLTEKLKGK